MKKVMGINTSYNGKCSSTILSGYWKFGTETLLSGFNGATAVIEVDEQEDSSGEDGSQKGEQ